MYQYNAKILNVVDGDTFDLDVDLGFSVHKHVRVRVLDVDTPESRGEERELGKLCTEYARINFLGKTVKIRSYRESDEAYDVYTDCYGRYLVFCEFDDGNDLVTIYNRLGINKSNENYSVDNVLRLREIMQV